VEHEFDHVLFGISDVAPVPNPEEVADFRYVDFNALRQEMNADPERFTTWFRICFERAADHLGK
jgi:isopentenyl-diphosphate delta-isomerase